MSRFKLFLEKQIGIIEQLVLQVCKAFHHCEMVAVYFLYTCCVRVIRYAHHPSEYIMRSIDKT